jgi:DTW domain-containing protein
MESAAEWPTESGPRGYRAERCPSCFLPPKACVCGLAERGRSSIRLTVLSARSEVRSASNTARLLKLWLEPVSIHILDDTGPADVLRPGTGLLFPTATALPLDTPNRSPTLTPPCTELLLLDGTWRQANEIWRRCERAMARAPHIEIGSPQPNRLVCLAEPWPSCYALRRKARGLCTFEAAALALWHLGETALACTLLERFALWHTRALAPWIGPARTLRTPRSRRYASVSICSAKRNLEVAQ